MLGLFLLFTPRSSELEIDEARADAQVAMVRAMVRAATFRARRRHDPASLWAGSTPEASLPRRISSQASSTLQRASGGSLFSLFARPKKRDEVEESFVDECNRIRRQIERRRAARRWIFRPGESKWVNYWDVLGAIFPA